MASFNHLLQLSPPLTLSAPASLNLCPSLFFPFFPSLARSFFFARQHFDSLLQRGPALPYRLWSRPHRRSFHRRRMRGTQRTGGTGWEEPAVWPVWMDKVHKTLLDNLTLTVTSFLMVCKTVYLGCLITLRDVHRSKLCPNLTVQRQTLKNYLLD